MYQPAERFAKAYQDELLREVRYGDHRPASKPANRFFIFRLLARISSHKEKALVDQREARNAPM